jgi:hypothetical protein
MRKSVEFTTTPPGKRLRRNRQPRQPSRERLGTRGNSGFDFFGSRPVDTNILGRVLGAPRLRRGYLQLDKGDWRIVAGQDKAILAPLDPISLSHVAVPLGATAGNLWGWLPQVRLEKTHDFAHKTSALVQVGVLRPEFSDSRLGDNLAATGGN